MLFHLPPLPFAADGLAPFISKETIEFHYGKHHKTYVDKLNGFLEADKSLHGITLEDIIKSRVGGVFNNAAQIYNHNFYWNCLKPNTGSIHKPTGPLAAAIDAKYGSFDGFVEEFSSQCLSHFGSGWVWLCKNRDHKLEIVQTHDAGCPITEELKPLLVCDVWEHAYYIDYRNARPNYVKAFWNIVNWDFVSQQYEA